MFSAANDIILPLMPSLRPQHKRSNGAVGATLMRSANQFNNTRRLGTDAQGKDGAWKARGKPNDAKRIRLPRIGRRGTYAPHSEGGNGHVSREGRRGNKNIVRVSGDSSKLHEANPRKRRAASHKARYRHTSRMRCTGTPRPSPRLAPRPARNAQTKHPGMARFACRA